MGDNVRANDHTRRGRVTGQLRKHQIFSTPFQKPLSRLIMRARGRHSTGMSVMFAGAFQSRAVLRSYSAAFTSFAESSWRERDRLVTENQRAVGLRVERLRGLTLSINSRGKRGVIRLSAGPSYLSPEDNRIIYPGDCTKMFPE